MIYFVITEDGMQTSGKTFSSYHDVSSSVKPIGTAGIKSNEEFIQLLQFLELSPITGRTCAASTVGIISQPNSDNRSEQTEEEDTEMKTVEDFEPDLSVRRKGDTRTRGLTVDSLLQDSDNNVQPQQQHQVSVVDGYNWFSLNSSSDVWNDWNHLELNSWLEEYINYVNRYVAHLVAVTGYKDLIFNC